MLASQLPKIVMIEYASRPQAVILIGIPASGKSSFSKKMLEPYGYKHISLDELRTRKRERMLLDECLQNEQNFVVDNTNTLPSERACYIAPARAAGYEVVGYFFRSRVSECMERNAQRTNAVPRAAVAAMSKRLCLPSLEEGYDRLYFVSLENGKFNISDWV